MLSPKWNIYFKPSSKTQGSLWKKKHIEFNLGLRGIKRLQRNGIFWIQLISCIYEHMTIMTACTSAVQAQAR